MSATDTPVPEATRVEALLFEASDASAHASMHLNDVIDEHLDNGRPIEFADAAKLLGMAYIARREADVARETADRLIRNMVDVYHVSSEGYTFPTIADTGGPN